MAQILDDDNDDDADNDDDETRIPHQIIAHYIQIYNRPTSFLSLPFRGAGPFTHC